MLRDGSWIFSWSILIHIHEQYICQFTAIQQHHHSLTRDHKVQSTSSCFLQLPYPNQAYHCTPTIHRTVFELPLPRCLSFSLCTKAGVSNPVFNKPQSGRFSILPWEDGFLSTNLFEVRQNKPQSRFSILVGLETPALRFVGGTLLFKKFRCVIHVEIARDLSM